MSGAATRASQVAEQLREALTHPPYGAQTNGLPAESWAPLLVVDDESSAQAYLDAFAGERIAACSRRRRITVADQRVQIWVDAVNWSRAEDTARRVGLHLCGLGAQQ